MYGDETAERLSHDVSCYLKHTTADSTKPLVSLQEDELAMSLEKSKTTYFHNADVPPQVLAFLRNFFLLDTSGLVLKPIDS